MGGPDDNVCYGVQKETVGLLVDNERLEERSTTRPGLFYSILVYKKGGCDHLCCANINFELNPNKYNHLSKCCVTCEMFEKNFNGGRRVIDMWSAGYGMLGDKKESFLWTVGD